MSNHATFFATIVIKSEVPATAASGASTIVDAFNNDPSGFHLINQGAQLGALAGTVISITRQTSSAISFFNIGANTYAGATTFLKIVADMNEGRRPEAGDIYALVGNVASVVATFTIMATGVGGVTAGVIGVLANAGSFVESNTVRNIYNNLVDVIYERYYLDNPSADYPEPIVAPDLTFATQTEIVQEYDNRVAACWLNEQDGEFYCDAISVSVNNGAGEWEGHDDDWWGEDPVPDGDVVIEPLEPDDEYVNDAYR